MYYRDKNGNNKREIHPGLGETYCFFLVNSGSILKTPSWNYSPWLRGCPRKQLHVLCQLCFPNKICLQNHKKDQMLSDPPCVHSKIIYYRRLIHCLVHLTIVCTWFSSSLLPRPVKHIAGNLCKWHVRLSLVSSMAQL